MEVKTQVFHSYLDILFFLEFCRKKNLTLNKKDLKHIINGDFDYVKKKYIDNKGSR